MFHTRLRTLLTLFVLTLALAASLLLGPTGTASASGPDFTLSANPTSLTLIRASATDSRKNVDVQIGSVNGFTGAVTLVSTDHYPKTVTVWEDTAGNLLAIDSNPVTITAPGELILQVTANASGSSSCSVFVPIDITATSGTLQHSLTVGLRVELRGAC